MQETHQRHLYTTVTFFKQQNLPDQNTNASNSAVSSFSNQGYQKEILRAILLRELYKYSRKIREYPVHLKILLWQVEEQHQLGNQVSYRGQFIVLLDRNRNVQRYVVPLPSSYHRGRDELFGKIRVQERPIHQHRQVPCLQRIPGLRRRRRWKRLSRPVSLFLRKSSRVGSEVFHVGRLLGLWRRERRVPVYTLDETELRLAEGNDREFVFESLAVGHSGDGHCWKYICHRQIIEVNAECGENGTRIKIKPLSASQPWLSWLLDGCLPFSHCDPVGTFFRKLLFSRRILADRASLPGIGSVISAGKRSVCHDPDCFDRRASVRRPSADCREQPETTLHLGCYIAGLASCGDTSRAASFHFLLWRRNGRCLDSKQVL